MGRNREMWAEVVLYHGRLISVGPGIVRRDRTKDDEHEKERVAMIAEEREAEMSKDARGRLAGCQGPVR